VGPADQLESARELIRAEANEVFGAAGIHPVDPSATSDVGFGDLVLREVPGQITGKRSTWQSFARGTSSEVDYLNGEIVLLGRLHGVATPVNELVQRTLGLLAESGKRGAEPQDIGSILPIAATN
jgi:ketopantoate reductase